MDTSYDSREKYCPMLGHFVSFSYCRRATPDGPCRRIRECRRDDIPIEQFLKDNYTAEQLAALREPPRSKMSTIFDCIRKAQQR